MPGHACASVKPIHGVPACLDHVTLPSPPAAYFRDGTGTFRGSITEGAGGFPRLTSSQSMASLLGYAAPRSRGVGAVLACEWLWWPCKPNLVMTQSKFSMQRCWRILVGRTAQVHQPRVRRRARCPPHPSGCPRGPGGATHPPNWRQSSVFDLGFASLTISALRGSRLSTNAGKDTSACSEPHRPRL